MNVSTILPSFGKWFNAGRIKISQIIYEWNEMYQFVKGKKTTKEYLNKLYCAHRSNLM